MKEVLSYQEKRNLLDEAVKRGLSGKGMTPMIKKYIHNRDNTPKSKALHKAKHDKFSKAVGKMVHRLDWEHKDTLS